MKHPGELPPELQQGPFSVADARARGVSVERLRRSDLRRPFHAVRASITLADPPPSSPATEAEQWAAARESARGPARDYAARMPPDQFFTHVTAAIVHGLPLPARLLRSRIVDVGTVVRTQRRAGRGVRGHLVQPEYLSTILVGGLRVSSAVDTWCQLAAILPLDDLVSMGDALVCREQPHAAMDQLAAAVSRCTGRPGARRLREALELVRPRTDSPRETALRLLIVRAGLPEPEVNRAIENMFGAFLAWGDLVYWQYMILIEYDGAQHRDDEAQFHSDVDRLDRLAAAGWRIIRVNKTHLGPDSQALIERIRRTLRDRGWAPSV